MPTSSIKVDSSNYAYYLQFFIKNIKIKSKRSTQPELAWYGLTCFPYKSKKSGSSLIFSLGQVNWFNSGQFCQFSIFYIFLMSACERAGQIKSLSNLNKKKKKIVLSNKILCNRVEIVCVPEIINQGPQCVQFNCW